MRYRIWADAMETVVVLAPADPSMWKEGPSAAAGFKPLQEFEAATHQEALDRFHAYARVALPRDEPLGAFLFTQAAMDAGNLLA
jgi:hypothetical protein